MRTFPIRASDGVQSAFEIENAFISRRSLVSILEGAKLVSGIRHLAYEEQNEQGEWLEFIFDGIPFVVWEPYGDSSRFWIGPKGERDASTGLRVTQLESVFRAHRPTFIRQLFGGLLTLRFSSILGKEKE